MHIYFSGIGGAGLSSLALLAKAAGYHVSGSDAENGINTAMLLQHGLAPVIGQSRENIASIHNSEPIDWIVVSAAIPDSHPEVLFAKDQGIKLTKRDELIKQILADHQMRLVAVSGTHGKTTTSSMLVWLAKQSGMKVSYTVGSNPSFGPSGDYKQGAEFLIIEADEYDRNMLNFEPYLSIITSLDFDHPDTYKNEQDYIDAFKQFVGQSEKVITWRTIADKLASNTGDIFDDNIDLDNLTLSGQHNRRNAFLAVQAAIALWPEVDKPSLTTSIGNYPGVERRFEKLSEHAYSDYAHHPEEIKATIQLARELTQSLVVVYQPHQNIRQHHIKEDYTDCFEGAESVYWLPTYLTREDESLDVLTPRDLTQNLTNKSALKIANLDEQLKSDLQKAIEAGKTVVFMGAGNIDDWARSNFSN